MSALLKVDNIHSAYKDTNILHGLSFHVNKGELVSLVDPSGCGKTTALRCIAGFQKVNEGSISLTGIEVSNPGLMCPPEQRHMGMVFQDYALFPHLNIADNIGFGINKQKPAVRQKNIKRLLESVNLSEFADRFPHELSGGQQQRVALARALAPEPDILLMDEPFSNLDPELRESLALDVRNILKNVGITGILVTHDQHEAFSISDKIGVMRNGNIEQWDTPYNLYHEPHSRFVAEFIGQGRFIPGKLVTPDSIETEFGILQGNRAYSYQKGQKLELLLRPDDIIYSDNRQLKGKVINRAFKGAEMLYTLEMPNGTELISLLPSHMEFQLGDKIPVSISADHLVTFSAH